MQRTPNDKVATRYFDSISQLWDNLYQERGGRLMRWANRKFRKDIWTRFEWVMKELDRHAPCSILDIGCGNGVYCVELAKRGHGPITAIDISPRMALATRRNVEAAGVSGVMILEGDGIYGQEVGVHDVALAVGVFDYIGDPLPALRAIRDKCRLRLLATFPKRRTWRAPVRKVRLTLKGCPVYFYTAEQVQTLAKAAGWAEVRFTELECIYCADLLCASGA